MKKRWIRLFSLLLCLLVFVSCNNGGGDTQTGGTQETQQNRPEVPENELLLTANGTAYCGIVRQKGLGKDAMTLCTAIADTIKQKTGAEVESISDTKKLQEGLVEILIGDTNRSESKQAKKKLGDFEYSVSVINGKVVVVGSDDVMLTKAIQYFCTLIAQDTWTIAKNYAKKIDGSDYLFNEYFGKGFEFTVDYEQVMKMSVPTATAPSGQKLSCVQGGCTDGTYTYACIINATEDDPSCMILKYDLKTQNRVAISKEVKLGHANDMAYNPDDNVLVVSHCVQNTSYNGQSVKGLISFFDPDTLEFIKTVPLKEGCDVSVTYDRVNKQYITIGVQNNYVYFYDRDFNLVRTVEGFGILGGQYKGIYLMQGIETDGTYLYIFDWHGGSEFYPDYKSIEEEISTRMHIMDLTTGDYKGTIELGIKREIENVGLIGKTLYIWANNITWTGAEFYIAELTPKV